MHALTTVGTLVLALAVNGCAPAAKTTEPQAPSAPTQADAKPMTATPSAPAAAAQPMGKRAAPRPGELVSPIIAARGGGDGWEIRIGNSGGYDHRVELTWDDGGKRGEGSLTFQPSADASSARMRLRGTLNADGVDKGMTVELIQQACSGDDGVAHEHALTVTVEGMAPLRGCGDLAI